MQGASAHMYRHKKKTLLLTIYKWKHLEAYDYINRQLGKDLQEATVFFYSHLPVHITYSSVSCIKHLFMHA